MSHVVYLALGTNMGDRAGNLAQALKWLSPQVRILEQSPIYETPPWGYVDQPDFLNQVVMGETDLVPKQLLRFLKGLEARLGRRNSIRNGPRPIDLDILFYDDLILEMPGLSIPHPRMAGRGFVLLPLCDLVPDLRHPLTGMTIREMVLEADVIGIHRYKETL